MKETGARTVPVNSWLRNLGRSGGFWGNMEWYDIHLERRLPLVKPMLEEMVFAIPPAADGLKVADICAGSGRATMALLAAYPSSHVSMLDCDPRRLELALKRAREAGLEQNVRAIQTSLSPASSARERVPRLCYSAGGEDEKFCRAHSSGLEDGVTQASQIEGVVDLVFCALALRHIVAPAAHYAKGVKGGGGKKLFDGTGLGVGAGKLARIHDGSEEEAGAAAAAPATTAKIETEIEQEKAEESSATAVVTRSSDNDQNELYPAYVSLFKGFLNALAPGGHVIVGDHVGHLSTFEHCLAMRDAGFVDVEVAWRQRDFFVLGGRRKNLSE